MTTITTIKKHEWLRQEIRREIIEQKIPAGQKLMTDNELMEKYKLSRATVIHAMKKLEEEGLVYRKIGAGTFVQDRTVTGEMAVVIEECYLTSGSTPIWNMTISGIIEKIRQQNSHWFPKIHMVTDNPDLKAPPFNCNLLDTQVVSNLVGVFTMAPLRGGVAEELTRRGIPSILLRCGFGPYHPNQIFFNLDEIYRTAFSHLAQVGCKTVGILEDGEKQDFSNQQVIEFSASAREAGIQCRPEWMLFRNSPRISEKGGWELFHRLWKQPVRPEAIFVKDDLNFRGVIRAALELGVRFPEDIRIMTVSPIGAPLPYHKSVTVVGLDIQKLTTIAMDMMEQLIRGEEPENRQIFLPLEVIKGETT